MKKYIKPKIEVIKLKHSSILCSSGNGLVASNQICTNKCKLWHYCKDRSLLYKVCYDKRY